jgi:hypothetical protein
MANLFNGYCYATIQSAADAEISMPIFNANSGLVGYSSFSATGATTGNLTFSYKTMITGAPSVYTMPRTYPACANVGYLTNYSGLDLVDAVTVSWLVVLAWGLAWGVKNLRRVL